MAYQRVWILGAKDPEMDAIEKLLVSVGEPVAYAAMEETRARVGPAQAYSASWIEDARGWDPGTPLGDVIAYPEVRQEDDRRMVYCVECCSPAIAGEMFGVCGTPGPPVKVIDHHRVGDPGFGAPPAEFLRGSSIGQVVAELARLGLIPPAGPGHDPDWADYGSSDDPDGRWTLDGELALIPPPATVVLYAHPRSSRWCVSMRQSWRALPTPVVCAAAGDHCLAAAYAGRCPGVDPGALWDHWRRGAGAAFDADDIVRATVLLTRETARPVRDEEGVCYGDLVPAKPPPMVTLGGVEVVDLRGRGIVPALPAVAVRLGVAYLAEAPRRPGETGRKIVLGGCGEGTTPGREPVEAFLGGWAAEQGLTGIYGDPVRGFAGAVIINGEEIPTPQETSQGRPR